MNDSLSLFKASHFVSRLIFFNKDFFFPEKKSFFYNIFFDLIVLVSFSFY